MAHSAAAALSLFREKEANLEVLPCGVPICVDHFLYFAEKYHNAYKQFAASLTEPTRVQPLRKVKSVSPPGNGVAEDKRRVFKNIPAWALAKVKLLDMIDAMVERNNYLGTSISGNEIWTCEECRDAYGSDGALILAGWDLPFKDSEHMDGVGEGFRVGLHKPIVAPEEEKMKWEGLTFVVDPCEVPMIVILQEW